jgi:hypothetical protein
MSDPFIKLYIVLSLFLKFGIVFALLQQNTPQ